MLPRPSLRKHRLHEEKEVQITAFLNLMVVLVPFLLLTAVFARITAIELSLPSPSSNAEPNTTQAGLTLIVSISEDGIDVFNGNERLAFFQKSNEYYNLQELSKVLRELKQKYPEERNALILSRPQIPYGILVEVIDEVREKFPEISLGEL